MPRSSTTRRRVVATALAGTLGALLALAGLPAASAAPAPAAPPAAPAAVGGGAPERGADVGSVPRIAWAPCTGLSPGLPALDCARYPVPLDYRSPAAGTVTLALVRLRAERASQRIGSLFLNPGGPGGSGVGQGIGASTDPQYAALRARFDLVGVDPRGTGGSRPTLACWDTDRVDTAVGYALARPPLATGRLKALSQGAQFDASCLRQSARLLPFSGTEYVARDLDRVRAAVGDQQLSYLGYSYGTYLGAVYADLFPSRVRVAALDGALDPDEYADHYLTLLQHNYRASEDALQAFSRWCVSEPSCTFGGKDPYAAVQRVVADLDRSPVTVTTPAGTIRTTGYRVVFLAYLLLSSGRDAWPTLGAILSQAQRRSGALFRLDPSFYLDGAAQNVAVECTDSAGTISVAQYRQHAADSRALAPVFGTALSLGPPTYDGSNGAACALWPQRRPVSRWTGDYRAQGAAPILVVGNTGDPSTPYSGAVQLTATLDRAALLTLVGEGHTSFSRSQCIRKRVDAYLIDRTLPTLGVTDRCLQDPPPTPDRRLGDLVRALGSAA